MCVWLHYVPLKWENIMTMFVLVQYVHKICIFHQVYWCWVCRNEGWCRSLLHNIGLKPSSSHIIASLRKVLEMFDPEGSIHSWVIKKRKRTLGLSYGYFLQIIFIWNKFKLKIWIIQNKIIHPVVMFFHMCT
jgi:hypothetical protein